MKRPLTGLDTTCAKRAARPSRRKVRPYGMNTSLMVSELLPPEQPDGLLTNAPFGSIRNSARPFLGWSLARGVPTLHLVPAEDQVKDFLTSTSLSIAAHRRRWTGIIELPQNENREPWLASIA